MLTKISFVILMIIIVSCVSKQKSVAIKNLDSLSLDAYHVNNQDFKKIHSSITKNNLEIFIDDKKISKKNHQKVLDTISNDRFNLIVLKDQNIIKFISK